VVITNWKRQRFIPSIIEQLSNQSYPKDKYEVIIVDDNTPNKEEVYDIVGDVASRHEDIKFRLFETHENVTHNPALRYNVGIRHAANEVVILNESDVLMQGEFLHQTSQNHEKDTMLWLGPEVIDVDGRGARKVASFRGVCDLGASIRKAHLHRIRGFDERTRGWGGIESDLWNRITKIGVHYRKDPDMKALHQAVEIAGIDVKYFFEGAAKPGPSPPYVGVQCNPESWGTLPTLEEIKL